jgi:hypothetical protein
MRYTEDDGTTPSGGARNPSSWVRRSATSATTERTSSSSHAALTADAMSSARFSVADALDVSFRCLSAISRHCFKSCKRPGSPAAWLGDATYVIALLYLRMKPRGSAQVPARLSASSLNSCSVGHAAVHQRLAGSRVFFVLLVCALVPYGGGHSPRPPASVHTLRP